MSYKNVALEKSFLPPALNHLKLEISESESRQALSGFSNGLGTVQINRIARKPMTQYHFIHDTTTFDRFHLENHCIRTIIKWRI